MDTFLKEYMSQGRELLRPYGFKRKKQAFVRTVNDVMQSMALKRYRTGHCCTVEFGVVPLCMGIECVDAYLAYDLVNFEVSETLGDWTYDKDTEKECIAEVMRYIKKYLLPFFERANCCASALREVIELEKLFHKNRLARLEKFHMENGSSFTPPNLLDEAKLFMALKNGDYDFALKIQRAILEQNIDSYQRVKDGGYMSDAVLERRRREIAERREDIKRLEQGEYSHIQAALEEREKYSKVFLLS